MPVAHKFVATFLVAAALAVSGAVTAQTVTTAPVQAPDGSGDPALNRHKRIVELLSQAHEELAFNRDPEGVRQKCFQVLALDPGNTQARLYLLQAERLRAKEALGKEAGNSSPAQETSGLELTARSRPTTPTVVLSGDKPGSRKLRPARVVVSGKDASVAPKPVRTWQPSGFMLWVAAVLLVTSIVLFVMIAVDRLLTARRRRSVQARMIEQMRASAPAVESPMGDGMPVESYPCDFLADELGERVAGSAAAHPFLLPSPLATENEIEHGKVGSHQPASREDATERVPPSGGPRSVVAAEKATTPGQPTEQPTASSWEIDLDKLELGSVSDAPPSQSAMPSPHARMLDISDSEQPASSHSD